MKMAKVKCLICGETFDKDKEQFFKVSNRYVHNKCLQETEHGHLLQLEHYIKTIMGIDKISVLIKKQISKYYEKGWSYKSIALTLKYFYEVKHNAWEKGHGGLGIVPWVFDEAKNYWIVQEQKKRGFMKSLEQQSKERSIVKIHRQEKVREKYNLDDIGGEE
jgi:hypothetical protein